MFGCVGPFHINTSCLFVPHPLDRAVFPSFSCSRIRAARLVAKGFGCPRWLPSSPYIIESENQAVDPPSLVPRNMSSTALTFRLPDLLANFPWPRNLSEHYREAKAESSAWTESFHPFDEDGLRGFNLCDFSTYLLTSV